MHIRKLLSFVLQYTIYGLAIACVFLLLTSSDLFHKLLFPSTFNSYSFNKAVTSAAPAVVNVYATKVYQKKTHPLFQDPLFQDFFGSAATSSKKYIDNSIGSGVIMNNAGYLLTNAHVVNNANDIFITLNDGRQAQAKLIGLDTDTDLAVINIQLPRLSQIPIGDSSKLRVGDVVLAIGNPYNFGQTVTQGIVSATSRKRRGISYFDDFIQTDADINLGNSGGALINIKGELIGINSAIVSSSGGSEGIGLATPINQALDIMNQIIQNGKVVRGWLGIEAQLLDPDMIKLTNLKQGGVLITAIMHNSPAEAAGLLPGDIMININNKNLNSPDQAIDTITKLRPGSKVKMQILRGWKRRELAIIIAKRPATLIPN